MSDKKWEDIRKYMLVRGIDIDSYAEGFLARRLDICMQRRGVSSPKDYAAILEKDPNEWTAFLDTLSINVTEFFRDPPLWEVLESKVLPELFQEAKQKGPTETLRFWCAGCASGEEPYSLSMVAEIVKTNYPKVPYSILASDVDNDALERTRKGSFALSTFQKIPFKKYQFFFELKESEAVIAPSVRQNIQLKRHNLLTDPYPKWMDMIMCRNTLIYFSKEGKANILRKFFESLRPGGFLVLGAAEILFPTATFNFSSYIPLERIYRK